MSTDGITTKLHANKNHGFHSGWNGHIIKRIVVTMC